MSFFKVKETQNSEVFSLALLTIKLYFLYNGELRWQILLNLIQILHAHNLSLVELKIKELEIRCQTMQALIRSEFNLALMLIPKHLRQMNFEEMSSKGNNGIADQVLDVHDGPFTPGFLNYRYKIQNESTVSGNMLFRW
jgi:hypothetical protein